MGNANVKLKLQAKMNFTYELNKRGCAARPGSEPKSASLSPDARKDAKNFVRTFERRSARTWLICSVLIALFMA